MESHDHRQDIERLPFDELCIAYHEAGHVATLLLFDVTPDLATIDSYEQHRDWIGLLLRDEVTPKTASQLAIACYAGAESQKLIDPRPDRISLRAAMDDEQALRFLAFCVETEPALRDASRLLIQKHWSLVQRIARELMDFGTLIDGELLCLFGIYKGDQTEDDLIEYRRRASEFGRFTRLVGRQK